jgi:hypothetical protein
MRFGAFMRLVGQEVDGPAAHGHEEDEAEDEGRDGELRAFDPPSEVAGLSIAAQTQEEGECRYEEH